MVKKILLAVVAFIATVIVYYIAVGSEQIVTLMKQKVNREVSKLQSSGFNIEDREIKESREHLVIDFNNTDEITTYINQMGQDVNRDDIEKLKGLKIGLDIEYNPTMDSAIAMDIYPIKAPDIFYSNLESTNNIDSIKDLEEILKNRDILIHIDVNKFLTGFSGYVKDINKSLTLKGIKFSGEIENRAVKSVNQTIDELSINISNELQFEMLNSNISVINLEKDNLSSRYSIGKLLFAIQEDGNLSIALNELLLLSDTKRYGKLADIKLELNITSINYQLANMDKGIFKNISSDTEINNIDIEAFNRLNIVSFNDNVDTQKSIESAKSIIKDIVDSNLSIDVKNISIDKINHGGKEFDGFRVKLLSKIDKDFDINAIGSNNTMFIMKSEVELSNELALNLFNDPKAMLMMMIFRPIDRNGKKYFNIEFEKGSLKVNGMPFM